MKIFAVKIPEYLDEACFKRLLLQLDSEKQQAIRSMKNQYVAKEALMSALLIRHIVNIELGFCNSEIVFGKNQYGKPHLIGKNDFHFNLSCSGDWAVCAIDSEAVGIDIEKIDYQQPKIVLEVLSSAELTAYNNLNLKDKTSFFYNIWTRKESYVKAIGTGLNIPLNAVTVLAKNKNDIFSPVIKAIPTNKYFFKQYFMDNDYSLTVCAMGKNFADKIVFIDKDNLLEAF